MIEILIGLCIMALLTFILKLWDNFIEEHGEVSTVFLLCLSSLVFSYFIGKFAIFLWSTI